MHRNPTQNRRGAQAVEFAMCLPILLFMAAATVDFGWYFQQRMVLTTATHQAAKAAANDRGDTSEADVATAVGKAVWLASGMSRDATYPEFDTRIFTASAGTDANDVALHTSGADDVVEVVSKVAVECLICLNMGFTIPDTISHTAVEYDSTQLWGG